MCYFCLYKLHGLKAELGRFPVENFINSQTILYLTRLHTDNLNPLLKEAFEVSKSLDSQGVSNTVFTVFRLLTDFVCLYNYEF
jgi:hypothetical protein